MGNTLSANRRPPSLPLYEHGGVCWLGVRSRFAVLADARKVLGGLEASPGCYRAVLSVLCRAAMPNTTFVKSVASVPEYDRCKVPVSDWQLSTNKPLPAV